MYHPTRLQVLGQCKTFVGVVTTVRHEPDGDYHVDVRPAPGFGRFLTRDNYTIQHGALVTEIMPGQTFPVPSPGERVAVFGTWVYDSEHGWNEIHPIWAIRYFSSGRTIASLPVVPPEYGSESSSPAAPTGTGGGGNCTLGYSPCLPEGPSDYDCYGGSGNGPDYTKPGVVYRVTPE